MQYLLIWKPLTYAVTFFGMIIEGDVLLFTIAFLVRSGYIDFWDTAFFVVSGTLFGDMFWYWLGTKISYLPERLRFRIVKVAQPFDRQLVSRPFWAIFITKFTYGLHHPILTRAGSQGLPLRKFLKIDIPASFAWMIVVSSLGYFTSYSIGLLSQYFRYVEIALVVVIVIFIFLSKGIVNLFTKRSSSKDL